MTSHRSVERYDGTTMRTDYVGHDRAYQLKRADGELGWGSARDLAEFADSLEKLFVRDAPRTGRLLEVGCGAGNLTAWLARRGFETHGIDIAPSAIAWARDNAAAAGIAATFTVGSVLALPYDAGDFDVVVDGHCLHCIIGEDRARMLAEVRRVLRGVFMVHTMCGEPSTHAVRAGFEPASRCLVRDGIATRYLGEPETILAELHAAGFTISHSEIEPAADADDETMLLVLAR
jgi:2-polyprenyl-3-methyl-5-hydroxy-6-metoxy-1,4-benzoquinol methylase